MMISITGKNLKLEYRNAIPSDIRQSYADIRKAEKMLGFKPKIRLEEGLKSLLRLY
ncbi:MAG: hypothetical protein QXS32_07585 [Candidatus Nezhaarchaeales archaeon]